MPSPRTDVYLLTPADAARILGLSVDMVRILAAKGQLPTAARTARGARFFRRDDVEELAATRAGRLVRHHSVKLYESEEHLAGMVADFLGTGLRSGGPAVVIATEPHRRAFAERLRSDELEVDELLAEERLVLLDARETLEAIMMGSIPDEARFRDRIGPLLDRMREGWPRRRTRAFGEMVDLLFRDGQGAAALELEGMWNRLAGERPFSLLCAYAMSSFASPSAAGPFDRVCDVHTRVVPTEAFDQESGIDQRHREVARLQQRARALAHVLAATGQNDESSRGDANEGGSRRGRPGTRGGRRILIVDDNVDAADMLGMLLTEIGHTVEIVHGGEEAIERARRFAPEIALLDIGLPDIDGYELCRRLRGEHGALRLIAVSGRDDPGHRERSRDAGFETQLVKPIRVEDLTTILEAR